MSRRSMQELIKSLQQLHVCPSCETHYHFDDIKILGQIDQYYFVQLGCHACSMPVLTTVTVEQKPEPKKRETDLKAREGSKFKRKGEITALEIAEFHRFLISENGQLGKLTK